MYRNCVSADRRVSAIAPTYAAALVAALGLSAPALSQTVTVSARCNIHGAGHATPPQSCANPGPGPGILPVQISIPSNATTVTFVDVADTVSFRTGDCIAGPEGFEFKVLN